MRSSGSTWKAQGRAGASAKGQGLKESQLELLCSLILPSFCSSDRVIPRRPNHQVTDAFFCMIKSTSETLGPCSFQELSQALLIRWGQKRPSAAGGAAIQPCLGVANWAPGLEKSSLEDLNQADLHPTVSHGQRAPQLGSAHEQSCWLGLLLRHCRQEPSLPGPVCWCCKSLPLSLSQSDSQ